MAKLQQFFVCIACDSVLLWRHCDKLCTSGFMDDAMYSHNGRYVASCIFLSDERIV